MMGYGYDPALSEGAPKPPIFLTSTFAFESAAAGKRHFEAVTGARAEEAGPHVVGRDREELLEHDARPRGLALLHRRLGELERRVRERLGVGHRARGCAH